MHMHNFWIRYKRCAKCVEFRSATAYTSTRCITNWPTLLIHVASQRSIWSCLPPAPIKSLWYRPSTSSSNYAMAISNSRGNSLRSVGFVSTEDLTLCASWVKASRERCDQTEFIFWDHITVICNEKFDDSHARAMNSVSAASRRSRNGLQGVATKILTKPQNRRGGSWWNSQTAQRLRSRGERLQSN